jgi:hypothetical protein
MSSPRVVCVAALQAAPVLLDREATLERLETWACVLRRTQFPCSPRRNAGFPVFQRLFENAVEVPGPVYDEESLVVSDCDLGEITRESMTLDVSGHYSRPDVFQFNVRTRE